MGNLEIAHRPSFSWGAIGSSQGQFSDGLPTLSITSTSVGSLVVSNFSPTCSSNRTLSGTATTLPDLEADTLHRVPTGRIDDPQQPWLPRSSRPAAEAVDEVIETTDRCLTAFLEFRQISDNKIVLVPVIATISRSARSNDLRISKWIPRNKGTHSAIPGIGGCGFTSFNCCRTGRRVELGL